MATPNITLTGSFQSPAGASTGYVIVELQGFGQDEAPRVTGTGIFALVKYTLTPAATFSLVLWGNDQLTPANTTYLIKFFDANGNFVASKSYTFTGGPKTVDISTL